MGKIKNFNNIAVSEERGITLSIIEAGLEAIDTKQIIQSNVAVKLNQLSVKNEVFSLAEVERIFLVGVGKCAVDAAEAIEEILGDRLSAGLVLDIKNGQLKKTKVLIGDHPMPSVRNEDATKEIIEFLKATTAKDLVLMIVSGGGTTLLCQPEKGTCEEEVVVNRCLFKEGVGIEKMNTLRKHLSLARGGFLAQYAYPSQVISLIFSDVPENMPGLIASGPTVKDETTIDDARKIISEFDLEKKCGFGEIPLIETPKDEKYFEKVTNLVLVSNEVALAAMSEKAQELGLSVARSAVGIEGEAKIVAENILNELKEQSARTVFLYGGETTVTKTGTGAGGRNLELALSGLRFVGEKEILISLATDGRDNSDFAGAICDIITKKEAALRGANVESYLEDNDSFSFFTKVGHYIETGNTGSNVSDIIIACKF